MGHPINSLNCTVHTTATKMTRRRRAGRPLEESIQCILYSRVEWFSMFCNFQKTYTLLWIRNIFRSSIPKVGNLAKRFHNFIIMIFKNHRDLINDFKNLKIPSFHCKEESPRRKFELKMFLHFSFMPPKWAKLFLICTMEKQIFFEFLFNSRFYKKSKNMFSHVAGL